MGMYVHEWNSGVIGIFLGGYICKHVHPTDTLWPQRQQMDSVVSKYPLVSGPRDLEEGVQ